MTTALSSPRLDAVLAEHAAAGRELQVAATRDGALIVDAATDSAAERAVFPVFSVGKGVVALAVHVLATRGRIDVDAPVARYWPAYGSNGKHAITIRHVLSHRAGVPQVPSGLTPERLGDRDWLLAGLEAAAPMYEPGAVNAYHALTFGWILGEVVRRADEHHRPFEDFVREELCEPLDADAFWFGIPANVEPRVSKLMYPDPPPPPPEGAAVLAAAPAEVALGPVVFNRADVHHAVIPAVGAIADARSLARLFAVYAGRGVVADRRYVSDASITECLRPRPEDADLTYGRQIPVGLGGLWIEAPGVVPAGRNDVLAHPGAGGSVAWAELDQGLSVAICHNRMFASAAEHPNHPFSAIADAVRELAS